MKMLLARSLRLGATALHRVASVFNEQAHLLEHGRETSIDDFGAVPFRVKFAERCQLIRDQKLDAGQRSERGLPVDSDEVERELGERLVHDGDRPADANVSAHDVYLSWLKFIEHRPGYERMHAVAVRRLDARQKAALQEMSS